MISFLPGIWNENESCARLRSLTLNLSWEVEIEKCDYSDFEVDENWDSKLNSVPRGYKQSGQSSIIWRLFTAKRTLTGRGITTLRKNRPHCSQLQRFACYGGKKTGGNSRYRSRNGTSGYSRSQNATDNGRVASA